MKTEINEFSKLKTTIEILEIFEYSFKDFASSDHAITLLLKLLLMFYQII